ncbi:hypothetical protein SAZ_32820 [Streptomyces noursei ZPM]|uniref:Uncharacterized protein n=1 Tax=Streptomyces noursei TaxID=1971 RepID=A0A401RA37_STRNR|nr:hypothetical protein SAZ_32820 [Streptomyces noursei ZPM]EOS97461.1 hypothetical protein K530_43778 [Streptomyces noursei CCRC 11814]EXU92555.1 hypothetical protein P354_15385 [Streptomyces noursei PD-1]GCB94468.1 hypothetical protein SALB_07268 [Streptomyces noursei]
MPSHQIPLLLAAFRYRFRGNLDAMSRHLVDNVAIAWDELGTDLLDGAPPALIAALTGGDQWPSLTLDDLLTPDGSPPVRMTVTDDTADAQDMQWGYVLHPQGIEVISVLHQDFGPGVKWSTDPRTVFSDNPAQWDPMAPPPILRTPPTIAPQAAPAVPALARSSPAHPAARR